MSDSATTEPDRQTLRTHLQALAVSLGKPPTVVDMHQQGDYHPQTYVDTYGSWDDALDAAGLDPNDVTQKITDTDLLSELQRLEQKFGRPPKKAELTEHGKYSSKTYQNRFGSWNNALQEAMLDTHGVSDYELINELQRLAEELGRPPRSTDMTEHGNHGTVTYYRRFNSWNDALRNANLPAIETSQHREDDSGANEPTHEEAEVSNQSTPKTESRVIVSPADLARTYNAQSYEDPWQAVEDYQRVLDYTAKHSGKGSSAVASALDLPRGRIRPWMEDSARPDPVRGIQTAEAKGWLPLSSDDEQLDAWNVLVAWIFAGGSIDARNVPGFVVDRPDSKQRLLEALDELDVSYETVRKSDTSRATEVRPTEDMAVLGRILSVLGAPQGEKNANSALSLPAYLANAPRHLREEFVDVYLLNRGQTHAGKDILTLSEERSREYLDELATLFRDVSGSTVTVSKNNVILSADAARNLYGKFGPQWS